MRTARALIAAAVVLVLAAAARAGEEGCGVCHGAERVTFGESVHRGADIGCVTCHGGDPAAVDSKDAAHAVAKGFRGKVARADVALACGTCHSDVQRMRPFGGRTDALAAWRTSHHGKAMTEKGATDAATCTDCHGAHDVRAVADPASPSHRSNVPATCGRCHGDDALMKRHAIETHATTDFAKSEHGTRLARGDEGVPSCADCHDAHAATPPGAGEVADVCGRCHRETRDRFRESPHFRASVRGGMRQCVTCHGNHAVTRPDFSLFDAATDEEGDGHGGVRCLSCHDPAKPGDAGAQTALAFGKGLRESEAAIRDAQRRVEEIEARGFPAVGERASLARARAELVRAVPLTHTVDKARVESVLRRAHSFVTEALVGCDSKSREERDRRIFGSVAGAVLLGIAGVLFLRGRKARQP